MSPNHRKHPFAAQSDVLVNPEPVADSPTNKAARVAAAWRKVSRLCVRWTNSPSVLFLEANCCVAASCWCSGVWMLQEKL